MSPYPGWSGSMHPEPSIGLLLRSHSRERCPVLLDGDRHYWSVWHGKAPISDYDSEKSRFFSEYGFQSFPEFDSVKRYAPYPEDWDIRSEVMMSHQRGGDHANG